MIPRKRRSFNERPHNSLTEKNSIEGKMPKLQKTEICVYCGAELNKKNKTRDHIPPKSLFTSSETGKTQLITVPACNKCNNECNVQDENAKHILNLCVIQMQRDKPEQIEQYKKTLEKNSRLLSTFKDSTRILVQDSITEIYTFEHAISIPQKYINDTEKVLIRIARGLYWHNFHKILNADNEYSVNFHAGLYLFESANKPFRERQIEWEKISELASLSKKIDLLPNVFTYWIGNPIDCECACCFLMLYR
ncbi:MAG: HNH endonuclease, partial [Gammaproteobacteria bacterium]|nr:HNH endonuclease [Gammaproteobacteria bacterium]